MDGTQLTEASASGALGTSANKLYLGAFFGPTAAEFFQGQIDDLRLYNRVLTISEINELRAYNPAATTAIPTLSEWGMIVMFALLGGTMVFAMRRKGSQAA